MTRTIVYAAMALVLISLAISSRAQEVLIPDPGLNSAIRAALQKPSGPLTQQDLLGLTILSAGGRGIVSVEGLEAARNLRILDLDANSITNFSIADALTNLTILDLFNNDLVNFALSNPSPALKILDVAFNSLELCSLPAGMTNLDTLFLEDNFLTNFNLPAGLTRLTQLDLSANHLASLTLPPDLTNLASLFVAGNPLTKLVLSEPAATNLAATVATLRNQGIAIFTYPLTVRLLRPRALLGAFHFEITGPPNSYAVLASTDLTAWSQLGVATNPLGSVTFTDGTAHLSPRKYYRAQPVIPSTNMVSPVFVTGLP